MGFADHTSGWAPVTPPRDALMDQSFGLNLPQDVGPDRELSSAVTENRQVERNAL